LLHTQPLVTLQLKWKLGADELSHYDALTLAIKVFDTIIDRSGFGNEVTEEIILDALQPLLLAFDDSEQLPRDRQRYEQVVQRLIGYLRNDSNRGRAFEVDYSDFNKKHELVRKVLQFKLLKETHGFSGDVVMQLSSEAINLFLNALDLDIESAQEANEAVVRFQLERGKFDQARAFAENARGQSLRYDDKIQRIIAQTRRDILQVDWRNEVDQLLVEATAHVKDRLRIENEIVETAENKLDSANLDEGQRKTLLEVVHLMRDCVHRHMSLNRQLMPARNHFLEQQTRQCFNDSFVAQPVNLRDEILQPLLTMQQNDVIQLAEIVVPMMHGPRTPNLLSLARLVSWQMQPLRTQTGGELEIIEMELEESGVEDRRFDDDVLADSDKVFVELNQPVSLSELLKRMDDDGCPESVQDAVVMRILDQFAPESDEGDDAEFVHVDLLETNGIVHDRIHGDELLITPVHSNES
jgi:tetratricopeptide (TPR) repeat protein